MLRHFPPSKPESFFQPLGSRPAAFRALVILLNAMSDPLSITTACLTLLSAVGKTSIALTTFIRGCREARSDLTSISGELTQLHLVLDLLKDDAAVGDSHVIPESLQQQIPSTIRNCSAIVYNIDTILQKYSGKTGAAKWVAYGKAEVAGLRMSLEAHRGSLSLVLELVSVSMSRAILEDVAVVRTDVTDIKQDTSQIPLIMAELTRLRAIVVGAEMPSNLSGQNYVLQQYLDGLTSYAETVCHEASIEWQSDAASKSSRGPSRRASVEEPRVDQQPAADVSLKHDLNALERPIIPPTPSPEEAGSPAVELSKTPVSSPTDESISIIPEPSTAVDIQGGVLNPQPSTGSDSTRSLSVFLPPDLSRQQDLPPLNEADHSLAFFPPPKPIPTVKEMAQAADFTLEEVKGMSELGDDYDPFNFTRTISSPGPSAAPSKVVISQPVSQTYPEWRTEWEIPVGDLSGRISALIQKNIARNLWEIEAERKRMEISSLVQMVNSLSSTALTLNVQQQSTPHPPSSTAGENGSLDSTTSAADEKANSASGASGPPIKRKLVIVGDTDIGKTALLM